MRSLVPDTDALETALLARYRPPVSIDRHPEFISASSALKEAKELDAAGLRYGALQRYLLAVLRTSLLRLSPPRSDSAAIRARLLAAEPRLMDRGTDHTIARMFLERALTELDRPAPTATALAIALGVADEVLPKYFAAGGVRRSARPVVGHRVERPLAMGHAITSPALGLWRRECCAHTAGV